jgi:hypothetical protein
LLGQQLPASLVLGGVVEVRVGDDALGQAGALQQPPEVGLEAGSAEFAAQEQRDHLRFVAWSQLPHPSTSRQHPWPRH